MNVATVAPFRNCAVQFQKRITIKIILNPFTNHPNKILTHYF